MKKRILHIIYSLETGGAEESLVKLVTNDNLNIHIILMLTNGGILLDRIKKRNIKSYCLNLRKNFIFSPYYFIKILKIISQEEIQIIHSWMYSSDVIASLVGFLLNKKIIWCVRNTTLKLGSASITSIISRLISIPFSYIFPLKIIYCSESAKNCHERIGYNKRISKKISNGIDCEIFKPLKKRTLKLQPIKIGMAARFNKQKNHLLLLETIKEIQNHKINKSQVKFYLAGRNINRENLKSIYKGNFDEISPYITFLGELSDMAVFYNSVDFSLVCSTYGEAFPNVIAESMACGTPCISTNIGDAKIIIGKYGFLLNSFNKQELSAIILKIIRFDPGKFLKLSQNAQKSVESKYSLNKMIKNYQKIYSLIK